MMTFEGLRRHLAGLVGSDNVWTDDVRLAAHAIARRQPRLVVQPETTAQAADILGMSIRKIQYKLHEYHAAPKAGVPAVMDDEEEPS